MAGNPNLIGGGRLTRAETSGDKRRFEGNSLSRGVILKRLWKYLGKNRLLLVLAVLSVMIGMFPGALIDLLTKVGELLV